MLFDTAQRLFFYILFFFFFNDTATTEIYTLSLHDALPISYYAEGAKTMGFEIAEQLGWRFPDHLVSPVAGRSEEHTSELQSQSNLVCRLLLEKKKKQAIRMRRTARPALLVGTRVALVYLAS